MTFNVVLIFAGNDDLALCNLSHYRGFCTQNTNGNEGYGTLIHGLIEKAEIECDIDETVKKFERKQETLVDMAIQGKHEFIVAFMKEQEIGSEFQRGEVATGLVKAYQSPQESPKGVY